MNLLQSKRTLSTVLLSCSLLFTVNASAEEVVLEKALAAAVQAQGQKVVRDLSAELSNSIQAELQRFSQRYSFHDDKVAVTNSVKTRQQKPQTSEE